MVLPVILFIVVLAVVLGVVVWFLCVGRGGVSVAGVPDLGFGVYDIFGGYKRMCGFEARGFFYVVEADGVWWLVDPLGCVFISKGVNHVDPRGDYSPRLGYSPYERNVLAKYGGFEAWLNTTVYRLLVWGFNTVGSWSYRELYRNTPYTRNLNVMASYGFDWVTGKVPDIFDEKFEEHVVKLVRKECASRVRDPLLLGYFLDNELKWGPDWRSPKHLLDHFMELPAGSPGKRAAVDALLEAAGGSLEKVSSVLGVGVSSVDGLLSYRGGLPEHPLVSEARRVFLRMFAERYFNVSVSAVRSVDPNHLILGVRFAGLPPDDVLVIAGRYVDVVTLNFYTNDPPVEALERAFELSGRPLMVTEFSFKAMDSGLPNTKGAGQPVHTQRERAYLAARFVLKIVELPYVVGYHWFQYSDQPAEGRFDGENSNFGLVNIRDEPWDLLTRVFAKVNRWVENVHGRGAGADELLREVSEIVKKG